MWIGASEWFPVFAFAGMVGAFVLLAIVASQWHDRRQMATLIKSQQMIVEEALAMMENARKHIDQLLRDKVE